MPYKSPSYGIPDAPPLPPSGPTGEMLRLWQESWQQWVNRFEAEYSRNLQELEALPQYSYVASTAATSPTTATTGTTINNLTVTRAIVGNAVVQVNTVLDITTDVASGGVVAFLRVTYPDGATSVQPPQLLLGVTGAGVGVTRATIGQQWIFQQPPPGLWTFEMLAFKAGAAASTADIAATNSNMLVSVT